MKRNKYNPFTLLSITLALITLIACERVLDDFEYEKKASKIVVNAILCPDSILNIHVSTSITYNPARTSKVVENAMVELYENKQSLGQLSSTGKGYYTLADTYPQAGATYRVVVAAEGYESVWAETTIPHKVENLKVADKMQTSTYQDGYTSTMMEYLLTYEVANTQPVFYGTSISSQKTEMEYVCEERETPWFDGYYYWTDSCYYVVNDTLPTRKEYISIYSKSSLIKFTKGWGNYYLATYDDDYQTDKIYFSNQNYSSNQLSLALRIDYYRLFDNINNEITIWTDSYDEVLFKFMYSLAKKYEIDDNPLAEKVSVYTNVNGGLGIFGSCNSTGYVIQYDQEFIDDTTPKY